MAKILTKNCSVCAKLFEKLSTCSLNEWNAQRKYCSVECANKAPRAETTKLKMREAKKDFIPWNKGKTLSDSHKQALRGKRGPLKDTSKMRGRRPWNKIGDGITPLNERIRKSPAYKQWRQKVYVRDNFTCVECGKHGGDLEADHIKAFALYPELRFEVSNGRTLCKPCHKKTETYGINQHTHPQLKR